MGILTGLSVTPPNPQRRVYRYGDAIPLHTQRIVCVEAGVATLSVVHPNGTEVLLGLFGARHIHCVVHTDVHVTTQHQADAAEPHFVDQLRARLLHMEAQAAAQAHPFLDQRVLGILALLAEDFGTPHPHGTLIDVRLTHLHLTAAVGANRSSITRTLGDLRTRAILLSIGRGKAERFC